jgi:hypothetical protein
MEQIKQTATEWLYEQLTSTWFDKTSGQHILEQANAKHKEQIIDAFTNEDNIQWDKQLRTRAAEQYYNEIYGGKNE